MIIKNLYISSFNPEIGRYYIGGIVEDDAINNGYADFEIKVVRKGNKYDLTFLDYDDFKNASKEKMDEFINSFTELLRYNIVTDEDVHHPWIALNRIQSENYGLFFKTLVEIEGWRLNNEAAKGVVPQQYYDTFCRLFKRKYGYDFALAG